MTKKALIGEIYFLHLAVRSFPRGGRYLLRVCACMHGEGGKCVKDKIESVQSEVKNGE